MDRLAGIKVVSFNHFLAGPLGAQILADVGADGIALEPPEGAFQRNRAIANHFVAALNALKADGTQIGCSRSSA